MYKFPYGIAYFKKIRQEKYFYVDRTEKIRELEGSGNVLTFLRPRLRNNFTFLWENFWAEFK